MRVLECAHAGEPRHSAARTGTESKADLIIWIDIQIIGIILEGMGGRS